MDPYFFIEKALLSGPGIKAPDLSIIGNALIIAPHQDDESLACGGTIALLRKCGFTVNVIFITDGSQSHPHSKRYPPERVKELRKEEARKALSILGLSEDHTYFLAAPDSRLNRLSPDQFNYLARRIEMYFLSFRPKTVFVPWRRDPHPDHIASWQLVRHALENSIKNTGFQSRVLEYPLWFWERSSDADRQHLLQNQVRAWKVDIKDTIPIKKEAIAAHASQLNLIIHDDPSGFFLSEEVLKHFHLPLEMFFEYLHP